MVNQEATLAAREKQKQIKERFRAWIFSDPDRTERLVRLYNDTYNNLRPRLFDGSHLDFPGMNRTITLDPHQKNAVWRGMSSGNTLLAHVRRRRARPSRCRRHRHEDEAGGLARKKPMYAVPNHHAGAVRPRVPAALPQRQAAGRRQGGPDARAPQAPDRQDRQRRVGRHHRDPQLLRADRPVARLPGEVPPRADQGIRAAALRRPSRRHRRAAAATSSRPSRSRRPPARNA